MRRLGVPKNQEWSALASMAFFALFIGGVVGTKAASNALFLSQHDPRVLPALYVLSAGAVAFGSYLLAQPLARYSAYSVGRQALRVSAVVLTVLGGVAYFETPGIEPLLYVVGETYTTILSILFWGTLSEVFDLRTSKRMLGIIGASGMAGSILGGAAVSLFSGGVHPSVQVVIAGLLLFASQPLFRVIGRGAGGTMVPRTTGGQARINAGVLYTRAERYPKLLGALVVSLSLLSALIDYLFRSAVANVRDAEGMNALFGAYNVDAGIIALLFQLFLSRVLLSRMGLFPFLMLIPIAVAISAAAAIGFSGSIMPLYSLKVVQSVGSFSVTSAAVALLYNPIPAPLRGSLRALLDGTVKKIGSAICGLLLLALGWFAPAAIHPTTVLAVVGLVVVIIRLLRSDYAESLNRKITGRVRRDNAPQPAGFEDASTLGILVQMLSDTDANRVLGALKLLAESNYDLTAHLSTLLGHRDERVRLRAIEWSSHHQRHQLWPILERLVLEHSDRRTRAAAARSLLRIDALRSADLLEPLVVDAQTDPALRSAGIEALFACPDRRARGIHLVMASFDYIRQGTPAYRREFARLLGNLPKGEWSEFLLEMLGDDEPSVVRLAAQSCGRLQLEEAVPLLAQALRQHAVRQTARDALAAYGDGVIDQAEAWLNDHEISLRLRHEVPRLLRMIGTARAADVMLRSNPDDDPFLQFRVASALSRLVHARPWLASQLDVAWTHAAIERQIKRLFALRQQWAALATDPQRFDLLYRAVQSRHAQVLDICLKLFALHGDRSLIAAVTRVLVHGNRASRGDALELLDVSLGHHPLKRMLLTELERAEATIEPSVSHDVAREIAEGGDRTLAAVAGRCLSRSGLPRPALDASILPEDRMSDELIDRIFLLQRVELFSELNIDELAAIADLARPERYEPGQAIYREHDPSTALFVIVSGDVSFHRDGNYLLRLGAFESFGQVGFLDRKARPASATAARRGDGVDLLVIDRQDFMDLVADRVEVLNGVFAVLTRRLREVVEATSGGREDLAAGQTATFPAVKLGP